MNHEKKAIAEATTSMQEFFDLPRFKGIKRLYGPKQVIEQQGTIPNDYTVAKSAAVSFYNRLRALFETKKQITTFGPYTPSQAVMMKRAGIEGIYLGGWATSAKGSADEDPGADLASYPLSQVPNEAAGIVRALLTADKNQQYHRMKMTEQELEATPAIDFQPYIIADADTGHGGDAHVRNLIRRFVEVGVTGYHIEDQKPGTKKCGHQGGKVLVSCDEQIKRINAARLQLDIMRVQGLIVARTDAEAASLIESIADERDQPFVLGATNLDIPSYKTAFLRLQQFLHALGAADIKGHELYDISTEEQSKARSWLHTSGILDFARELKDELTSEELGTFEKAYNQIYDRFVKQWEEDAAVMTYRSAVANLLEELGKEGEELGMCHQEWLQFAKTASLAAVRQKAMELGVDVTWDCDLARTPEGYYQVKGGIPFAIAKSLAVAPYADFLWMETKTADLKDAETFARAIHKVYPDKMLAYNLSPSFNWDTTGMTEEEMKQFPEELGKLGFVFNFITYGGHQIDGLASDEFANSLQTEGMLALAKVQRKLRLLDSPYKTPQTHVGGPRLDGALASSSGRTATTRAMGKGSTQFQHLKHTELPTSMLQDWINRWRAHHQIADDLTVRLRPLVPGSSLLELSVMEGLQKVANVIFAPVADRNRKQILSIRDQNLYRKELRQKRLMTLLHLYLLNRYGSDIIHYLTPTEDNLRQCEGMKQMQLFGNYSDDIDQIIVAEVNTAAVSEFVSDGTLASALIQKRDISLAQAV
ncbi:isocitrate lyase/phosphoenolpyruvate mutase family protein [Marinoscillum furvescens]|uniref:Isocitrate lyase n=1 Tax=Marinoscillum furvescens DSM 4134 TaxID=1122208 RepID=A0A3D9KZ54_MARFU|nr:isocitrate lyase/phosphoenolpyruvate mutase family protein [Marinoscillum furvescens]RED92984.1 isocitrate lyase [Marinoscillum furvescens DSM 4134]